MRLSHTCPLARRRRPRGKEAFQTGRLSHLRRATCDGGSGVVCSASICSHVDVEPATTGASGTVEVARSAVEVAEVELDHIVEYRLGRGMGGEVGLGPWRTARPARRGAASGAMSGAVPSKHGAVPIVGRLVRRLDLGSRVVLGRDPLDYNCREEDWPPPLSVSACLLLQSCACQEEGKGAAHCRCCSTSGTPSRAPRPAPSGPTGFCAVASS